MLSDPAVAAPLKFTAVLSAFAQLSFPLRLSDLRTMVPDSFWQQHCRISYVGSLSGFVPIYFGEHEWFYTLRFTPSDSGFLFGVYFVATDEVLPDTDPDYGEFDPPGDLQIHRFTLVHPFLRDELHEPDGIRLFGSA